MDSDERYYPYSHGVCGLPDRGPSKKSSMEKVITSPYSGSFRINRFRQMSMRRRLPSTKRESNTKVNATSIVCSKLE